LLAATEKESIMASMNRRSTLALGLGAASLFVLRTPSAEAAVGEEKELAKGVKQKMLGEGPAIIPGYSRPTVSPLIVPLWYCHINGFQGASSVEKPWLGGEKRMDGWAAHPVEW
jgi:hypothetical protein